MLIPPLLLLNLFVVVVMFSIGLRVSGGELLDILRKRSLFVRTLLANCVLIPAIGFLLVRIFPLTPDASAGILLLAAIPGTPIALQFTRQAKTRLAFAAAMTFVLSLVSVAMTPLAVEVMPQTAQRNQRPILLLMMSIVLYIGLPLCAGLWAARHAPKIAPRLVLPEGSPENEVELGVPGGDHRIGHRQVDQREEARTVIDAELMSGIDVARSLVPKHLVIGEEE